MYKIGYKIRNKHIRASDRCLVAQSFAFVRKTNQLHPFCGDNTLEIIIDSRDNNTLEIIIDSRDNNTLEI